MTYRSPLFGRRIHIAGSIGKIADITQHEVERARRFVERLVTSLVQKGATFVVPVDGEPRRDDHMPICFDWLIWNTLREKIHLRPAGALQPYAIAVKHDKNDEQIPEQYQATWDEFSVTDNVWVDSAAHWNMNSKRMEVAARRGDILITIGGGEGVLFLANAYHDAGKPVIPVNFPVSNPRSGTGKLCEVASSAPVAERFFRTIDGIDAYTWLNRVTPKSRSAAEDVAGRVLQLLENLQRSTAFAVRLLNPEVPEYAAVDTFFGTVVKPVLEDEYGYSLVVVDGKQQVEKARIDQDIFAKLQRAGLVIADMTGQRPNCFLEFGFAIGRGTKTVMTFMDTVKPPFDVTTYAGHPWRAGDSVEQARQAFREHLVSISRRPALVNDEPLIP